MQTKAPYPRVRTPPADPSKNGGPGGNQHKKKNKKQKRDGSEHKVGPMRPSVSVSESTRVASSPTIRPATLQQHQAYQPHQPPQQTQHPQSQTQRAEIPRYRYPIPIAAAPIYVQAGPRYPDYMNLGVRYLAPIHHVRYPTIMVPTAGLDATYGHWLDLHQAAYVSGPWRLLSPYAFQGVQYLPRFLPPLAPAMYYRPQFVSHPQRYGEATLLQQILQQRLNFNLSQQIQSLQNLRLEERAEASGCSGGR